MMYSLFWGLGGCSFEQDNCRNAATIYGSGIWKGALWKNSSNVSILCITE